MPSVTQEEVDQSIKIQSFHKMGEKTTVCLTTMKNGFEIVTSSSCVNPEDFDMQLGCEIARKRAIDKVWELLGFTKQNLLHYLLSEMDEKAEEPGG